MEIITAIGLINSIVSTIKGIAELAQGAVRYKEEVQEFAEFIGMLGIQLVRLENYLKERQISDGGRQTLNNAAVASLEELFNLLEASKRLLTKLQSYSKIGRYLRVENNSSRIRKLRGKINDVRLKLVEDMLVASEDEEPLLCKCYKLLCKCCCWPCTSEIIEPYQELA